MAVAPQIKLLSTEKKTGTKYHLHRVVIVLCVMTIISKNIQWRAPTTQLPLLEF